MSRDTGGIPGLGASGPRRSEPDPGAAARPSVGTLTKAATLARGVGALVPLLRNARGSRESLQRRQRERARSLVEFAAERSPFYAAHYGGRECALRTPFHELPTVTKTQLMGEFDAWVTDRTLTETEVVAHLGALGADDQLFRGRYRVMGTGGSSGTRGVFVYDPREWAVAVASVLRATRMMGVRPGMRVAVVGAAGPLHMTSRISLSVDLGLYPTRRFAASARGRHVRSRVRPAPRYARVRGSDADRAAR